MPSKQAHNTTNNYSMMSVIPKVDRKTALKRMENRNRDRIVNTVGPDSASKTDSAHKQYITSSGKRKSANLKQNQAMSGSDMIRFQNGVKYEYANGSVHTEHPKTTARHVVYTKTRTGTIYRNTEDATMEAYKIRHISRTKSLPVKSEPDSQFNGYNNNTHSTRNVGLKDVKKEIHITNRDQSDVYENQQQNKTSSPANHIAIINSLQEAVNVSEKNNKTYTDEQSGLNSQLGEKSVGNNLDRQMNDITIKELLKEGNNTAKHENNNESNLVKSGGSNKRQSVNINKKCCCFSCGESVYQKDKVGPIRDVLFHTQCFRCCQCGYILTLYNYYQNHKDMQDKSVYCRSHQPSSESSKVDIADKNIQAVINKPKLDRVNSNVRGTPDVKNTIGTDAISIKNAINAPKLGTYNPTVRVTQSGSLDHIDHRAVFVQTAMKAPKLEVFNQNVRPVPLMASPNIPRKQFSVGNGQTLESPHVQHGSGTVLHSLYLH